MYEEYEADGPFPDDVAGLRGHGVCHWKILATEKANRAVVIKSRDGWVYDTRFLPMSSEEVESLIYQLRNT